MNKLFRFVAVALMVVAGTAALATPHVSKKPVLAEGGAPVPLCRGTQCK